MSAKTFLCVAGLLAISTVGAGASSAPQVTAGSPIAAGRYLVVVTGCNHCHTQGWQESNGHVPEARWLDGGHAPPNVPTPNLRTMVRTMSEASFVQLFRTNQPPGAMPFYNLRTLSDVDLKAIYAYIKSLGT
jgi:mono/diheme cytochrome c family protein